MKDPHYALGRKERKEGQSKDTCKYSAKDLGKRARWRSGWIIEDMKEEKDNLELALAYAEMACNFVEAEHGLSEIWNDLLKIRHRMEGVAHVREIQFLHNPTKLSNK